MDQSRHATMPAQRITECKGLRLTLLGFLSLLVLLCGAHAAQALILFNPVGTAFTYQGILNQSNSPADGTFDFKFNLYNLATAGALQGDTIAVNDLQVDKGRFSVNLDFGAGPFANGDALWLEIAVRPGASTGAYTTLAPRQPLKPAPYAITALSALTAKSVPWSALTGVPAPLADGDANTTYSAGAGLKLTGTQFSVNFPLLNGRSTLAARSDHSHADLISSVTANAVFLHKLGPDTMASSGTQPTLTVTQTGKGQAGQFVSPYDVTLYASTSASPRVIRGKPFQPILPFQIITPAALYGDALAGGNGVYGQTTSGNAIFGTSKSGNGIMGTSAAAGSGGYFTGPTGVSAFGQGSSSQGGYFKADSGYALQADGSATVTQNLVVGGTLKVTQGITARSLTTTSDITVSSVQYRDPRTHYLAIPPEAFTSSLRLTYTAGGSSSAVTAAEIGSGLISAPVNLPDGATITNVSIYYCHSYTGHTLSVAFPVTTPYGILDTNLMSATLPATGNLSAYHATVSPQVSGAFVDNSAHSYRIMFSSAWDATSNLTIRIYKVLITYTIPEAQ